MIQCMLKGGWSAGCVSNVGNEAVREGSVSSRSPSDAEVV